MRTDRQAIGGTGHETSREKLLDDDRVAILQIFRLIAERERARSTSRTNDPKAISEQRSGTERERVMRLLNVGGHTNSGGETAKLIAQRMPV